MASARGLFAALLGCCLVGCTLGFAGADRFANDEALLGRLRNLSGLPWAAGPSPRFTNHTVGQVKRLCGSLVRELGSSPPPGLRSSPRVTATSAAAVNGCASGNASGTTPHPASAAEIPVSFDVREQWPGCASVVGHIRDQAQCGSCWAFATTEALNDRLCNATEGAFQSLLSVQVSLLDSPTAFVFFCRPFVRRVRWRGGIVGMVPAFHVGVQLTGRVTRPGRPSVATLSTRVLCHDLAAAEMRIDPSWRRMA